MGAKKGKKKVELPKNNQILEHCSIDTMKKDQHTFQSRSYVVKVVGRMVILTSKLTIKRYFYHLLWKKKIYIYIYILYISPCNHKKRRLDLFNHKERNQKAER